MPPPAVGMPVGLEIPVQDTKRASIFYSAVFNWKFFKGSHVGAPEEQLLVFKVDGEMFPGGGIVKKVSEGEVAKSGASKVFFYVDSIENAMEKIEANGGKALDEKEAEGDHAYYQYFRDSEGNTHGVYTYRR